MVRNLLISAQRVAGRRGLALEARNQGEADDLLGSFKADPNVEGAALYDSQGKLFARYPLEAPLGAFPVASRNRGYQFSHGHLLLFEPVAQRNAVVGTLFVKSEVRPLFERLRLYGGIASLVL